MIKAVIFDWGGVLIENPAREMAGYIAISLGVPMETFNNAYRELIPAFQKGTISEGFVWEKICGELNVPKPEVSSLWREAFRSVYTPKEEIFSLASQLKGGGYKVGFLSNAEVPAMNFFHEQHYDTFDVTVFSCAEGTMKPERRIYEITLERLGVQPNQAIFIDDREDFIDGAKEMGINTILFISEQQVKEALASFSVIVATS